MKDDVLAFLIGLIFGAMVGCSGVLSAILPPLVESKKVNEPTPAVQMADPGLVMCLAELASDEHRARIQAERNLDELRREAQSVVAKLLSEIQRLKKRPTLKKGSIDS